MAESNLSGWLWGIMIVAGIVLWSIFLLLRSARRSTPAVVFLDLETTGLKASDEVLEIAIIDAVGNVLVHSLVRPTRHESWPEAEEANGIGPADVAEAPTLAELEPAIAAALRGTKVVIYNVAFDSKFLHRPLRRAASVHCCMLRYAEFKGDWSDSHNGYRWHKLTSAARDIGYRFEGDAHRALADCRATRAVWQHMEWVDSLRGHLMYSLLAPDSGRTWWCPNCVADMTKSGAAGHLFTPVADWPSPSPSDRCEGCWVTRSQCAAWADLHARLDDLERRNGAAE